MAEQGPHPAGASDNASGVRRGVVLAGRAGTPGEVDERLLTLGGRPLVLRAIDMLRAVVPHIAVAVGRGDRLDLGDAADVELIEHAGEGCWPLAGIVEGLRRFAEPLLVVPATLAFPDPAMAAGLLRQAAPGDDVVVPAVAGVPDPALALVHPRCLPVLERLLTGGERDLAPALADLTVRTLPFPGTAALATIDSIEDWQDARREADRDVAGGRPQPPLVAIVAKSGSGKTTFIEKLLPELCRLGLRVGTIKHDAHDFEIDHPGKDTYRHGAAGAQAYVISSAHRLAYVARQERETSLPELARRFMGDTDLVLVEGYKREAPHKVELFRRGSGHAAPLYGPQETLALITDDPDLQHTIRFGLGDAAALAAFLVVRLDSLREY